MVTMWSVFYGYVLSILLNTSTAKIAPISSTNHPVFQKLEFNRHKRQFGFPQAFQGFPSPQINENAIFFDNDNVFQEMVSNRQRQLQSTPRPQVSTTIAIPGMGTTQSACEDRCQTTNQYNPICGDNSVTYPNLARYQCALRCGRDVRIAAYRACPRTSR